MNIPESQESLVREAYDQWLAHPVTRMLLANLDKHKSRQVRQISAQATVADVTDAQVRQSACSLKTTDAIIQIITDYNIFKNYLQKE